MSHDYGDRRAVACPVSVETRREHRPPARVKNGNRRPDGHPHTQAPGRRAADSRRGLLTAAGLLGRSFLALTKVNLGFEPGHVLTFQLSTPESRYGERRSRANLVDEVVRRIGALPGVVAAAAIYQRPFAHAGVGMDGGFILEGQPVTDESFQQNPPVNWEAVTPRYFELMKMQLRRGRLLAALTTRRRRLRSW